jgi:hypothetical protein
VVTCERFLRGSNHVVNLFRCLSVACQCLYLPFIQLVVTCERFLRGSNHVVNLFRCLTVACSVVFPAFHTVAGHLREIPQRIEPRCEPLPLSVRCLPLASHFGISEVELWKHFINETTWQMDWTILRRQA